MATGEIRSFFYGIHLVDALTSPLKVADQAMDNFKARLGDTNGKLTAFGQYVHDNAKQLSALGPELAIAGALMTNWYKEGVVDAAKTADMYSALYRRMGDDTDAFIEQMQEASGGMLTEAEIIQKANMAMTMGIDPKYLPTMTKAARAAVRQMGGDMDYYFDSIISGTARQSKLQLDNMGIIIKLEEVNESYAKSIGKSVNALTEEEKRLAYQAAVAKKSEDMIGQVDWSQQSLNETMQESTATIEDLRAALSEGLIPILQPGLTVLVRILDGVKALPSPLLTLIGIGGAIFAVMTLVIGAMLTQQLLMATLGGGMTVLGVQVTTLSGAYVALATTAWGAVAALGALLLELLPIILPIAAVAAAILIVQDIISSGWEDSELKKFLDMLEEKLPWLKPLLDGIGWAFRGLADGVEYLNEQLAPLVDLLDQIYENPLARTLIGAIELTNPLTMASGVNDIGSGYVGMQEYASSDEGRAAFNSAFSSGPARVQETTMVNVTIPSMNVQPMSKDELAEAIKQGVNGGLAANDRKIAREFRAAGV